MLRYDLSALDILVVDDSDQMLLLLRDLLLALGVGEVRTAASVERALALFTAKPADIVVTDWHMRPAGGAEFVARLRSAVPGEPARVPIILLTGQTDPATVMQARDLGINEFLAKPVSARTLYARLVAIIERPRPFVMAGTYRGPDRRRRERTEYSGPERRDGTRAERNA